MDWMNPEGEGADLCKLIMETLESRGLLNKIKAELRAAVILALSDDESFQEKVPLVNKDVKDFMNTRDGQLALSVVREFLEYFNLNFALSVFDPEVSNPNSYISRETLCENLNLNESELNEPILSALLKKQAIQLNECSQKNANQVNSDDLVLSDKITENPSSLQINTEQKEDSFDETVPFETNKDNKSDDSSFSLTKTSNNRNIFSFWKPEEKDIFKDQSIDNFFDDPVPSEKYNFLHMSNASAKSDQNVVSSRFLTSDKGNSSQSNDEVMPSTNIQPSEKGSLSSLRDLPSLTKQELTKPLSITSGSHILGNAPSSVDNLKEDISKLNLESNEEYSDKQINSEESIEEEIEEEFSAGLDDLLNSSLSLGDDATSDQTISQTSVVDGIDHIEPCNSGN